MGQTGQGNWPFSIWFFVPGSSLALVMVPDCHGLRPLCRCEMGAACTSAPSVASNELALDTRSELIGGRVASER